MTRKDAVVLASRALALYLLAWGLSDLSYVPQTLVSLHHHYSVLYTNDYGWTYECIGMLFRVIRILALFFTATWLYRGGHRVEKFFLPSEPIAPVEQN